MKEAEENVKETDVKVKKTRKRSYSRGAKKCSNVKKIKL